MNLRKISYLFNEINACLQIHTKVNKLPMNTLLLVFLLLQHKHVVVEKLLQSLIGVVDADLLKSIVLENKKYYCKKTDTTFV